MKPLATLWFALLCAALWPASACAQPDSATAFEQQLWLTSGFRSHHTKNASRYRENNDGIGLEWHVAPTWQFNAGHYNNSVGHGSSYWQAGWSPFEMAFGAAWRLRAGGSVGIVNGYPRQSHGGYFPTLVPTLALDWRRVALNLVYIPTVGGKVDGAVALQLKVRLL
jgi:hypothetical protein